MRHPHRRQYTRTHQEVPPAGIILVIVNSIILPLAEDPAELACESR